MDLLTKECQPAAAGVTEALADWYKMAQTTFLQAEILRKDVSAFEDEISSFAVASGSITRERSEAAFEEALESLKESRKGGNAVTTNGNDSGKAKRESNEVATTAARPVTTPAADHESKTQIRRALRSILATQDEVC